MGKQLYILRHAKSEPWSPLGNDFSRSLSDIGNQHAEALSVWVFDNLATPDTVLCSPARRTRETLAPIMAKWPQLLSSTDYVDSMYGASLNMLLTLTEEAFSYTDRLMLVGHNPGFENLLIHVLQAEQAAGIHKMATGTLAVLEFGDGFRRDARNGKLLQLCRRKDFSVE
jgi:phosphohistidine phosphatase SixA